MISLPRTFPIYLTHQLINRCDSVEVFLDPELKMSMALFNRLETGELYLFLEPSPDLFPIAPGNPLCPRILDMTRWLFETLNGQSNEFPALLASMEAYKLANDGTPFHLDIFEAI